MMPTDEVAYRRRVLATVFIGTFMAPLDSSIVNIALPTLSRFFGAGIERVEWVVMAYLLTTSSLLLFAGRLGDMLSHKRVYIAGFLLFTAASALCGLAGSLNLLILARVVQALGATCMLSTGTAILTEAFPPAHRGRALGTLSVSVSLGLTAGPFLGGFILAHLGWRWIFYVNLPVGLAVSLLAFLVIREKPPVRIPPFDIRGTATLFLSLFCLLLALSQGGKWGWGSAATVGLLAGWLLWGALFVGFELRAAAPLLDLSLFRNRLFAAANLCAMTNYISLFTVTFVTPFLLLEILRLDHRAAGLVLTSVPLATGLIAPLSGTLSDRIGSRLLSSAGLGLMAAALLGLSRMPPGAGPVSVAGYLALAGFASGLFQPPNTSAIMGSVPRHRVGVASGMQATMRNLGMVIGVAVAGAVMVTVAPRGAADPALPDALSLAYLAGACAAGIGMAFSLVRGPHPQP